MDARAASKDCVVLAEFLLHRVAAGDSGAVRDVIDRYGGLVWSLARRFLFDATEAEDAVQEIFIDLWRSAGRFDPAVAGEATFIAMIARRRLIDRRRRSGREPVTRELGPIIELTTVAPDVTPDGEAVSDEAARALRALGELKPDQQRVLRLSILNGLSHEKIAQATGLPLGTVKTHVRRGLMRIREILGEQTDETARDAGV